jgi:isoleucyl-tRNA synthetase
MIPFMTEDIYQNLVCGIDKSAPESIHLCDFPVADESLIDKDLEAAMEAVLDIVVMGRAARNAANIKNRQPIGTMFVKAEKALGEMYQEIIADELNVKKVVFTDDVRDFTSYTFKPQLKTVGPKYGKFLGGIKQYLAEVDGNEAMDSLNENGCITFDVNGTSVVLSKDDLLIDMAQKEGYVSQADNNLTVVLDTNLTEELIEEGFVREVISKIQTMRKEADFEVTDKIVIYVSGNEKVSDIVKANAENIKGDVMAVDIKLGELAGYSKEWNINGETVSIGVEK